MDKKHARNVLPGVLIGIAAGLVILSVGWTCIPKNGEAADFTGAALPWVAVGCLLATSVASMNRKKEKQDE